MDVDVSNSRVQVLDVNDLMRRNGLDRCAFVVIFALIGSEYDGSREGGCATSRVGTGKGSHRPKSGGVRGVGAKTALPAVRALCRIWEAHGFPAVGEEGTFIDFAVHVISQSTAEPDIPVVLSVPATVAATKLEAATLEARGDMSRCRLGSSEAAREDHRQLARTLMALRKQENAGFAETLKTTARGYRREPEPAVVSLAQRAEAAANERDRFLAAQAPSSSSSLATPALFEIQLSPSCGPLTWGRFYAAEVALLMRDVYTGDQVSRRLLPVELEWSLRQLTRPGAHTRHTQNTSGLRAAVEWAEERPTRGVSYVPVGIDKTNLPSGRALVSWASVRGPGTEAQQPLRPTTLLATKKARDRTARLSLLRAYGECRDARVQAQLDDREPLGLASNRSHFSFLLKSRGRG